jgi:hypothetical protein
MGWKDEDVRMASKSGVVVGDTSSGDLKNGLYAVNRSEEWVMCREF